MTRGAPSKNLYSILFPAEPRITKSPFYPDFERFLTEKAPISDIRGSARRPVLMSQANISSAGDSPSLKSREMISEARNHCKPNVTPKNRQVKQRPLRFIGRPGSLFAW